MGKKNSKRNKTKKRKTACSTGMIGKCSVDAEYNILRAEILQYMEEYQNLRNMMYAGTVTLLGINTWKSFSAYLYLLPLIIIVPSYITFFDYWKSVSVASVYMQVFLEGKPAEDGGSLHMWETRLRKFGKEVGNGDKESYNARHLRELRLFGLNCHHLPYFVCAGLCFLLYFFEVAGETAGKVVFLFSVIFGLTAAAFCIWIFAIYHAPDVDTIEEVWRSVKEKEENSIDSVRS